MAIEIFYLDDGKGVVIQASGVVTGQEIIKAQGKIYDQHKIISQQYHIIDKSLCTEYNVTAADIKMIADLDYELTKLNSDIVMAIIESQYLQFSLTEAWQVYVESFVRYSKSFKDHIDASTWIVDTLKKISQDRSNLC